MKQNLFCIKRSFLLLCLGMLFALGAMAQSKITGKVIASDDKLPVVGATVKLKMPPEEPPPMATETSL
jgi:hypothetical protein